MYFEAVKSFGIDPSVGFITRMSDKLSRLSALMRGTEPQIEDEAIYDSALDLAGYCALIAAFAHKKKVDENKNKIRESQAHKEMATG